MEATYRRPSKIISDAGTQIVGAKNKLEKHYANSTVFKLRVVPTAAHHFIGGAEKMVGMMKKLLKRKLDGAAISHNELLSFLLEVAKMLNTHPLVAETSEDGEKWRIDNLFSFILGKVYSKTFVRWPPIAAAHRCYNKPFF
ncbi:MAG: hypothetical protein GY696_10890 [Gammaproteobacteria bacterium]|nr:hypothetical protein [Gammaproteobacteria bacterium]